MRATCGRQLTLGDRGVTFTTPNGDNPALAPDRHARRVPAGWFGRPLPRLDRRRSFRRRHPRRQPSAHRGLPARRRAPRGGCELGRCRRWSRRPSRPGASRRARSYALGRHAQAVGEDLRHAPPARPTAAPPAVASVVGPPTQLEDYRSDQADRRHRRAHPHLAEHRRRRVDRVLRVERTAHRRRRLSSGRRRPRRRHEQEPEPLLDSRHRRRHARHAVRARRRSPRRRWSRPHRAPTVSTTGSGSTTSC